MGSDDRDGNRLIKANFTADGAAKLKESVMEKLKEFMGDYSDDTLVGTASANAAAVAVVVSAEP